MEKPVVIIGGGITGIGTARDLSMRGLNVLLIERGELGGETSTYFHGMLHSGARYAVNDPIAAEKCWKENQVLKNIAPQYIEDTGGFFLKTEEDSEEYYKKKLKACRACGIPVEEVSASEILEEEACISKKVDKGLKVPDGVIKPLKLLEANAEDAEKNGADIRTETEVEDIEVEDGRVTALRISSEKGSKSIEPAIVVNATGPWTGKTAEMASVEAEVAPTKGVLTVMENPGVRKVLNRCRPADDGDIIVPTCDRVVVGTTSQEVEDPDSYERQSGEENIMIEEGAKIADISGKSLIDSYWGLRPLYSPSGEQGREATREFRVIDHERDSVENMITVIGGKWTTYRDMAEKTSDLVCDKLGVEEVCQTREVPLPDISGSWERDWPPV